MAPFCALVFLFLLPNLGECKRRKFYLSATEVEWDYAPSGQNLVNNKQAKADLFIKNGPDRIGSVYTKVTLRQFTDDTFTTEIPKPDYFGYVGPLLHAETGDTFVVTFYNNASEPFTLHPHGVMYLKKHEGADYLDGTSGADKNDDEVKPGDTYVYEWLVPLNFAPTEADPNCLPWGYHSHFRSTREIAAGLVAMLLTCKPGTLDQHGMRKDVDQEVLIYMDIIFESSSVYFQRNLNKCGKPKLCKTLHESGDGAFEESTTLHPINGFMYGNMPDIVVREGSKVAWYFFGLNVGSHSVGINGQTFKTINGRKSSAQLMPATFITGLMRPVNPGRWLIMCRLVNHFEEGMSAFLRVLPGKGLSSSLSGKVRKYYIAAKEVVWDYGPGGQNKFSGGSLLEKGSSSETFFKKGQTNIGGKYKKVSYFEYTDGTFTKQKKRKAGEEYLGFLGPVIRGEVGETLEVTFHNFANRPYSILPVGLEFDKKNEGQLLRKSRFNKKLQGKIAEPGETITYEFSIPKSVGPTKGDPNCLTSWYLSAVDIEQDLYTGLIGPLLICRQNCLDDHGKQKSVDHEFVLFYNIMDENLSWLIDDNIQKFTRKPNLVDKSDPDFREGNMMHALNGRMFGNLEGLDMCINDKVSWHVFSVGGTDDAHTFYIHGHTARVNGVNRDTRPMQHSDVATLIMRPVSPGTWAIVCRNNEHYTEGMTALYHVNRCGMSPPQILKKVRNVRTYFIAAVEIDWDYAPNKIDIISGESLLNSNSSGNIFVKDDDFFIGSVYRKAVYREYTDGSFKTMKPHETHLGVNGPFIKAEVGEIIVVKFKNMASRPYSMHAHGVFYDKNSEGALYEDGTNLKDDDAVLPGDTHRYRWLVPKRAGPGKNDLNCVAWLYYSGTNPERDTNTGLFGPLITCRRDILDKHNRRRDVDKEFATTFDIVDENNSWLLEENIRLHAPKAVRNSAFASSNEMNSINGYIFGNLPGLIMDNGDHIAWYVMAVGSGRFNTHTAHFHGQTVLRRSETPGVHRADVIDIVHGTTEVVEMMADNPGTWLYHCHISFHVGAGMSSVFTVRP